MVKGTFPAGFVPSIQQALTTHGYTVRIVRKALPLPLGPENPIVDSFGNDDPRYFFQMETVRRLLKHGRLIAQIATGGGKTKIALLCTTRIRRPTVFVTTRSVLMYQMRDAFLAAGIPCGVMGDGDWSPIVGGVNVAMIQTLRARVATTTYEDEVLKDGERRANAEEKDIATLKASLLASGTPKIKIVEALGRRRRELAKVRPNLSIYKRFRERVEIESTPS